MQRDTWFTYENFEVVCNGTRRVRLVQNGQEMVRAT